MYLSKAKYFLSLFLLIFKLVFFIPYFFILQLWLNYITEEKVLNLDLPKATVLKQSSNVKKSQLFPIL